MFKPGSYNVKVKVGFYTQVSGLGQDPDDVKINGGVTADAKWDNGNATRNFWRSVENLAILPPANEDAKWAVSQAAPMRRVHVNGKLNLFDFDSNWNAGWASGGFIADSIIDKTILPASQQQFFSRNNNYEGWLNGVWNMMFVGDNNPPKGTFPIEPYTVIEETPIIKEKPYLYIDGNGDYAVFVPSLEHNKTGVSWQNGSTPGKSLPINTFYIAHPDQSRAADINKALSDGKNVLFTPGFYYLDETIHVNNPETVVMGLGYASLIPTKAQETMIVQDVEGAIISSLFFIAGVEQEGAMSRTLLKVGDGVNNNDHANNPILLSDVFFGIGGFMAGSVDIALEVNSNNVIGDHFWIWRADHGTGASWGENVSNNGIIVNGKDVTIYGLFNEHHMEYQTIWNGEGGRLYFYQSEIPYDPPSQEEYMSHNGTVNGYASYKVADHVTTHEAWGLGVYAFFRDAPVKLENAIEVPRTEGVKVHHATTIWLSGTPGSEITHIINGMGGKVYANSPAEAMRQTYKHYTSGDSEPPSVPTDLQAVAISSKQINLSWTASSDNVGVEGYDIYRNGLKIGYSVSNAYSDSGLKARRTYSYTVVARDSSGNASGHSTSASATTERELAPYDQSGWTAVDSKGNNAAALLDGNTGTRWTIGSPMVPGQYFIVDMKQSRSLSRVVLSLPAGNNDYARGYEVYISDNGQDWGQHVASGTGSAGGITIDWTDALHARYVKVVQTGTSSSWWAVNEFAVYSDTEKSLDRRGWTATTNPVTDSAALLFDDNLSTRWSSGTTMVPGQYIAIDMKHEQNFNKVIIDSRGSSNDYSRSYKLYVSSDGVNWGDAIIESAAIGPYIVADFPDQNARYLKIEQAGTNSSWWSIHEINVYRNGGVAVPVSTIAVAAVGGETAIAIKGGSLQMNATVLPAYADDADVTWSVVNEDGSPTDRATISETGLLKAVKNGTVKVVAAAADGSAVTGSATIAISGQNPVTSINVTTVGNATTIATRGGTLQLNAAVEPVDADNTNVAWSVVNEDGTPTDKATISEAGLLKAVKNGTVKVVAAARDSSGASGSITIAISGQKPVTSIVVTTAGNATTIATKGGTLQLNAAVEPEDADDTDVTWSVVNEDGTPTDKATISDAGLLTAVKNGTVKVVAAAADGSGVTGSAAIAISGQNPVTSINVNTVGNTTTIATRGGTLPLNAAVEPVDADNTNVAWSVVNEDGTPTDKATISEAGLLKAVKNGTVKVVAAARDNSGISGNITIVITGQEQASGGGYYYSPYIAPTPADDDKAPSLKVENGTAVWQLQAGESEGTIDISQLKEIGSHPLTIKQGDTSIIIPSAVLKQIIEQSSGEAEATVTLRITAEATQNLQTGSSNLKSDKQVYNLALFITGKDGKAASLTTFAEPVQIILPIEDHGFNKSLLGVYVYDEATKAWIYAGGKINKAGNAIAATVTRFGKFAVMEYDKSFADVSSHHWGYQALKLLAARHIVTGINETEFRPNGSTTRAEFVTLLVKALDLKDTGKATPFEDVQSTVWYAGSIAAAYEAGLVSGVSEGMFNPNSDITREQMAYLIVRAYAYISKDSSAGSASVSHLKDSGKISPWAVSEVGKAIQLGLMKGKSVDQFAPRAIATRIETAQVILNLLNKLESEK
ncbi:hypothetical protein EBB07_02845 [Paenibacillaceae bacterium]|nr:hypothetical protein EBB07_02845 [Paenibacillaceae bacterium]